MKNLLTCVCMGTMVKLLEELVWRTSLTLRGYNWNDSTEILVSCSFSAVIMGPLRFTLWEGIQEVFDLKMMYFKLYSVVSLVFVIETTREVGCIKRSFIFYIFWTHSPYKMKFCYTGLLTPYSLYRKNYEGIMRSEKFFVSSLFRPTLCSLVWTYL